MYMIQLTDYLYSGDTLIRILHKYSAALEMEAKKTNNIVDLSHVSFLKEFVNSIKLWQQIIHFLHLHFVEESNH